MLLLGGGKVGGESMQLGPSLRCIGTLRPSMIVILADYPAWLSTSALGWGHDPAHAALQHTEVALSGGPAFGPQGVVRRTRLRRQRPLQPIRDQRPYPQPGTIVWPNIMSSSAPADRFHGDHCQPSTDTAGLPGSSRPRTSSEEPGIVPLSSLQKEINLLQQTTQTLRELAHTQKATAHRDSNAMDPVQRLAPRYNGPPAQLDLTASQPGRPPAGKRPVAAEPLTRTEEAVLRRLTTTLSLAEISRERNVSRGTV